MIPMIIPINSTEETNQGGLLKMKITEITEKPKYGTFTSHKNYDVLYADYTNEQFLVVDDNRRFVWVEFCNCKAVF